MLKVLQGGIARPVAHDLERRGTCLSQKLRSFVPLRYFSSVFTETGVAVHAE